MQVINLNQNTPYCSHIINYGSVGTGKSTLLKNMVEHAFKQGKKIVDLYDEFRLENCYYALPNLNTAMYKKHFEQACLWGHVSAEDIMLIKAGKKKCTDVIPWTPQGFPTECYIPAVDGTPEKLPNIFKPYRIPYSVLDIEEFRILLGGLTANQLNVLEDMLAAKTYAKFIERVQDKPFLLSKLGECSLTELKDLVRKIDKIHKRNILCERDDELAIDFDRILRDKSVITSFSFFNIDDENLMYLLISLCLRMIFKLKKRRMNQNMPQYPETCLVIREIQNIAPARGQGSLFSYEGQRLSAYTIHRIQKEPRDIKIRIYCDSQTPSSVAKHIRQGMGSSNIFQLDLMQLTALTEIIYLDGKTFIGVQNTEVGVHAKKIKPQPQFSGDRTGVHFPVRTKPPESWCKTPDDNFLRLWKEYGSGYVEVKFKGNKSIVKADTFTFPKPEVEQDGEKVTRKGEQVRQIKLDSILGIIKTEGLKKFSVADLEKSPGVAMLRASAPETWTKATLQQVLEWGHDNKLLRYTAKAKKYYV